MAATALQRKIFSRWCSQKLVQSPVDLGDCVEEFANGYKLVALVEALSENKMGGKPLKENEKGRIQMMSATKRALDFCWDQGVMIKLKPSPENLVDKDERAILGLVWGIMQRFLKFGDDDEEQKLSAEDALLMWAKNQTKSYGLDVTNFTKSFRDGKAYAALIHKNRPQLIDPATLSGSAEDNLQQVFDAATKYFGLEQYLKPSEIAQLDKKSAFIYASEYYYGIAEQRKLDLAARRIARLITFTEVNDKLKADYKATAADLTATLERVTKVLTDRTVSNTMAGAKAKLAELAAFRKDDKPPIVDNFFALEQGYNTVALRLADNNRPAFNPGDGLTVKDFAAALKQLEVTEQEHNTACVAELNRQIKLVQLNSQHERQHAQLAAWIKVSEEYLGVKEDVQSSGSANYHINVLAAFNDESKQTQATAVVDINKLGAELAEEKYEHTDKVQAREAGIAAGFERLAAASTEKGEVLADDLARNIYKEKYHLVARNHLAKFETISARLAEKEAYLSKKEDISDVPAANLQIAILEAYAADNETFKATQVPALQAMGKEVLDAHYKSDRSEWKYEEPDSITSREQTVLDTLAGKLTDLYNAKKETLDADLARELEKERLRLLFANQAASFTSYTKALVDSVSGAHFGFNLAEVEAYAAKKDAEDAKVAGEVSAKQAEYKTSFDEGAALGVVENVYTKYSLDDLSASGAALSAAQATRTEAYTKELARVRYNDGLCKEFAAIANPLVKSLDANKQAISDNDGELQAQLDQTRGFEAKNEGADELKQINEIQAKITEAGVDNNPHTFYTAEDLATRVAQYNSFLAKKAAQIEEELRVRAMRGLTEEQLKEIDEQFAEFDGDDSGHLSLREFKAALFSLGEEKPTSQVKELLTKYGDGTKVDHDGFKEFMLSVLGDGDTQEEILNGFTLIGQYKEHVTAEQLGDLMDAHFVEYIQNTAAAKEDGFEFNNWTVDMYSR